MAKASIDFEQITAKVVEEMARETVKGILGDYWGNERDQVRAAIRAEADRILKEDEEIRSLLKERLITAIRNL